MRACAWLQTYLVLGVVRCTAGNVNASAGHEHWRDWVHTAGARYARGLRRSKLPAVSNNDMAAHNNLRMGCIAGGRIFMGEHFFCDTVCSETLQIDHTASAGIGLWLYVYRVYVLSKFPFFTWGGSAAHLIHASLGLWVYTPNGTLIGSAICAGLISVANRQTDHRPCHFICSRRQCSLIIHTYTQALIQPVLIVNSS